MKTHRTSLFFLLLCLFQARLTAQGVFWIENGGGAVDSSAFNGSNFHSIKNGLSSPYGIAFNPASGFVYWTDVTAGTIMRSNRDGSNTQTLLSGLSLPRGIALDASTGNLFWLENGSKKLRKANLDGTSPQDLVTTGLTAPAGIAVDAKDAKIYWTDNGGTTKNIGSCGLDGSSPTVIVTTSSFVSGIAVDTVHSKIYWTESGSVQKIRSANLDGSGVIDLITLASADPRGIAVAGSAGRLFWTNYLTNTVEGALVDGSGISILVSNPLNNPLMIVSTSDAAYSPAFSSVPGSALSFNGTSAYVDAGSSSSFDLPGSFTVEGWFEISAFTSGWEAIVTKGDGAWRIQRYNTTDNLDFGTNGLTNQDLQGSTNVNDGNWHFFAAVYNGSTKTLYVDGHVDASSPVTGTLSTDTYAVYFGENAQMTGRYLNGSLDEVRIWNIARTEQQVRADMFTTINGGQNGLLGYWQFNEGSGTTAADSVSGNNGTLVGPPSWVTSNAPVGSYGSYGGSSVDDSTGPVGSKLYAAFESTLDSLDFLGYYEYGSSSDPAVTAETFPSGVDKRSPVVYGAYEVGITTAGLKLDYSGLSGIANESGLQVLRRAEADSPWANVTANFTQSLLNHTFSASGLTTFGQYSIGAGSDNALAVEATEFTVSEDDGSVTLTWRTHSEIDNAGFNVLRRDQNSADYSLLASYTTDDRLKGAGTSTALKLYSFIDDRVSSDMTYSYKVQSVSRTGVTEDLKTLGITVGVPKSYALYQNYPNPFNPSTTVRFDLKQQSLMTLEVYNMLGQNVLQEHLGTMNAGRYNHILDMGRFASGVYLYRIVALGSNGDKFVTLKKMMLVK